MDHLSNSPCREVDSSLKLQKVQLAEGKCSCQQENEDPATEHQHIVANEAVVEAEAVLDVDVQRDPLAIHVHQYVGLQELSGD